MVSSSKIIRLSKLSNEELIKIIRDKEFEIKILKKQLKIQSKKWQDYYRHKEYKK